MDTKKIIKKFQEKSRSREEVLKLLQKCNENITKNCQKKKKLLAELYTLGQQENRK